MQRVWFWVLGVLVVGVSQGVAAHELNAPDRVVAADDHTFEPMVVFTAGPAGAVLNRLSVTYIQSFGIAFADHVEYGCETVLGPGESLELEMPFNFDTLFDSSRPVFLDLTMSTECPGDPESTQLRTSLYALPAFCDDPDVLCLQNGRFVVRTEVDLPGVEPREAMVGAGAGQKSGSFWFFEADTTEVLVKFVEGCSVNGHYWLYLTGATDLPYSVSIADTFFDEDYEVEQNSSALDPPHIDTLFAPCP